MKRLYFTIVRFFLGEKAFNPDFNEAVRRCTDKLNAFLSSSSGAMFLSIMETQRRHVMISNPRRPFAGFMIVGVEDNTLCGCILARMETRGLGGTLLAIDSGWRHYKTSAQEIAYLYLNAGLQEKDFLTFLTAGVIVA
jgi:hypothetical protein